MTQQEFYEQESQTANKIIVMPIGTIWYSSPDYMRQKDGVYNHSFGKRVAEKEWISKIESGMFSYFFPRSPENFNDDTFGHCGMIDTPIRPYTTELTIQGKVYKWRGAKMVFTMDFLFDPYGKVHVFHSCDTKLYPLEKYAKTIDKVVAGYTALVLDSFDYINKRLAA